MPIRSLCFRDVDSGKLLIVLQFRLCFLQIQAEKIYLSYLDLNLPEQIVLLP